MFIYNEKSEIIGIEKNYKNKVIWINISRSQKLSESFIREMKDKVNWYNISYSQKLSENFIREFKDKVIWYNISIYQKLSENFIREMKDKVIWDYISSYQKLSNKFRKEFNLKTIKDNWINNSVSNKLRYIKKHKIDTVYPLNKDKNGYFLTAYKSVRSDFSSVYNYQYTYEIGKTYESWCDCNLNEENSFGLSAWTKKEALEYYSSGKLLKVKIYLKDLGAIVHKGNKLRAFKIIILEEVK
jgi:hypothetical protein